jgi:prepilin-type N-terminal cleavage/methylation domain-containing protein
MLIPSRRSKKAFTLLELIVVIVILGLLAALAIPTFARVTKKSQDAATSATLAAVLRDTRALMAFQDKGASWEEAVTTATSETAAPTAAGTFALALSAVPSEVDPTSVAVGSYQLLGASTPATTDDGVLLALMSPSDSICVGVASLTSATAPYCALPGSVPANASGVSSYVLSGDAVALPSVITPKPLLAAPGAVTDVRASSVNGVTTLTWSAPATGGAVAKYLVSANGGAPQEVTAPASSFTFPDLTAGASATFTVTAVNATGPGAASAPSAPVVVTSPVVAPGAPTNVVATAGTGSASLTWSAPASDGGAPVTSYNVYLNGVLKATSTTPSASVTGLNAGTSVAFTVKAVNSAGEGAASSAANAVVPTAPAAPVATSSFSFSSYGGRDHFDVSWAPSSSSGVTGYRVTLMPQNITKDIANPYTSFDGTGVVTTGVQSLQVTPLSGSTLGTPATAGFQMFNFTGAPATFTAPSGVSAVKVYAKAGNGGYFTGQGGPSLQIGQRVSGTLAVTPGAAYTITVGGAGGNFANSGTFAPGGYNGGGSTTGGGGGGGATDIRAGGTGLGNRVVVAGGGGGAGGVNTDTDADKVVTNGVSGTGSNGTGSGGGGGGGYLGGIAGSNSSTAGRTGSNLTTNLTNPSAGWSGSGDPGRVILSW